MSPRFQNLSSMTLTLLPPMTRLASFRNAECAVCKEDFNVDDDAIFLPCSHVFHAVCSCAVDVA